jgi:hypothetical protein
MARRNYGILEFKEIVSRDSVDCYDRRAIKRSMEMEPARNILTSFLIYADYAAAISAAIMNWSALFSSRRFAS